MDDDIDIYGDLENFEDKKDENYFSTISELKSETIKLKDRTKILEKQIENLEVTNNILKINLSSLLKTAKNEITRKDRIISELRQQLENITFRRNFSEQFKFNKPTDFNIISQSKNKVDEVHVKQEPILQNSESAYSISLNTTIVTDKKFQKNDQSDNFIPTLFGQRLKRKIREEEEETAELKNDHLKQLALDSIIEKDINEEKVEYIKLGTKANQFSITYSKSLGDQDLSQKVLKRSNDTASSINRDKRTKLNEDYNGDNKIEVKNLLEHNTDRNVPNMDISCKNDVGVKKHEPLNSSNNESKPIYARVNKNLDTTKEKKDSSNISKKNINSRTLDNSLELFCEKNSAISTEKVIIPRRRKATRLTDSSTSMTIVISENNNNNEIFNKKKI